MILFLRILTYIILIPVSLIYPTKFIAWLFGRMEYKFIPFRYREGNFNLLLLPLLWFVPWLAFWIWWFMK